MFEVLKEINRIHLNEMVEMVEMRKMVNDDRYKLTIVDLMLLEPLQPVTAKDMNLFIHETCPV